VSVAEDRAVVLFDLATHARTQTLFRGSAQLGSRPLSTVLFNVRRQALLVASNVIGLLEHDPGDQFLAQMISHNHPVNVVIYNQLFDVVGQLLNSLPATRFIHNIYITCAMQVMYI